MKRKRNRNRQNDDVLANQADPLPAQPDSSSTQAVKDKFLAGRQLGASVSEAARWAGVPRATLYRWRRNDPDFAQAWNGSQDHDKVAQALEFEAYKRAIRGNDRLLVFLLKSYIPYTFNEKRQAKSLDQQEREAFYADFLESVAQKRAQAQKDFPQDDEDAGEPLDQDTEQTWHEDEEETWDEEQPWDENASSPPQPSAPPLEAPLSHRAPSIRI